ncbi:MAG: hypothetical protein B7C55_07125 [Actinomycetales bacterium mxb001]|nr:MAG: hypothetical protein B7C55_07125 [Actinomycetales bacterium mxb001]
MTEQQPPADSSDAQPAPPDATPAAATPPAPEPAAGYAPPPTWPPQAASAPGAYPPPAPPPPPAAYPPGTYAPAPYGYAPVSPPTSTNAIIGLVLAIVSWVICPVIPAIIALVLAAKSQQEIRASQGAVGGEGLNTATRIISWINIGFWALLIVGFGLVFLIAILAGATQRA